jgi:hypothetical protein
MAVLSFESGASYIIPISFFPFLPFTFRVGGAKNLKLSI